VKLAINMKNRSRVAFVHFYPISNDNCSFIFHVLRRMTTIASENHELHFLYTGEIPCFNSLECNFQLNNFSFFNKVNSLFLIFIFSPYIVFTIYRFCKKRRITHIVNLFDHYTFWVLAIGARFAGVHPIMRVVGRSNRTYVRNPKQLIGLLFEKLSILLSWRVVTVSKFLSEEIKSDFSKTRVISPGVDTAHFGCKTLLENTKINIQLLFVGRMVPVKNLPMLIRVIKILRDKGYSISLTACGEGPLLRQYRHQFECEWIDFKGHVGFDDLPSIYADSDILIVPSLTEGLGNVILEAFSSGVPVIGSAVGGINELLSKNRGLTFSVDSDFELELAIISMLRDRPFRLKCVESALKYVKSQHSIEVIRNKYVSLISEG
jgi:glycosyltransferase involved in cell wall biosynthesis